MKYILAPFRAVRHHPWRTLIAVLVLAPIAFLVFATGGTPEPEYVTTVSAQTNLTQLVEAVGTVTSDRNLDLQFPTSGIVSQVNVTEGQRIRRGQTIATLRNADLAANIASQSANLAYMQAQLRGVEEGNRQEDIVIAEANLESQRASLALAKTSYANSILSLQSAQNKLDVLNRQATIGLSGQISLARSTISQQLATADNSLFVMEGVFNNLSVADAINRSAPETERDIRAARLETGQDIRTLQQQSGAVNEYQEALLIYADSRSALMDAVSIITRAYDLIVRLPETANFAAADKEPHKTTLATQRSNLQSALSTLDTQYKAFQDAVASYDTQIAAEQNSIITATNSRDRAEADIKTAEAAVRVQEAQLALKKAGSRGFEIEAAQARVSQAAAELSRARAQFSNTVLTSPVDGVVTKLSVKVGENTPIGSAITVLGDSPYRIEMFVSEIDIPKIKIGQKGSVALDAFPNQKFTLEVVSVDAGVTDTDGVPKYKVQLDFLQIPDGIKMGMTGDTEVTTGSRENVVTVPRRAVIEDEQGRTIVRILKADSTIEQRPVTMGMEGGSGDVEIMSGLAAGETVIVLVRN